MSRLRLLARWALEAAFEVDRNGSKVGVRLARVTVLSMRTAWPRAVPVIGVYGGSYFRYSSAALPTALPTALPATLRSGRRRSEGPEDHA